MALPKETTEGGFTSSFHGRQPSNNDQGDRDRRAPQGSGWGRRIVDQTKMVWSASGWRISGDHHYFQVQVLFWRMTSRRGTVLSAAYDGKNKGPGAIDTALTNRVSAVQAVESRPDSRKDYGCL
jgi:hypothetical protein